MKLPVKDIWGVIMQKEDSLAEKETISPEDLWDKPLILSKQETDCREMSQQIR